jgi:hypothetical protein
MNDKKKLYEAIWATLTPEYKEFIKQKILNDEPELVKVEEWNPKGGEWYIRTNGTIGNEITVSETRIFGIERETKKLAEVARDRMRVFNRMLAFVHEELDYDYVHETHKENFYIYFDDCLCNIGFDRMNYSPDRVYMTREVAIKLRNLIREGKFKV